MFFNISKILNDQFVQDTLKTIMPSFIPICQAVSEKMFEKKANDDRRKVMTIAHTALRQGELRSIFHLPTKIRIKSSK